MSQIPTGQRNFECILLRRLPLICPKNSLGWQNDGPMGDSIESMPLVVLPVMSALSPFDLACRPCYSSLA